MRVLRGCRALYPKRCAFRIGLEAAWSNDTCCGVQRSLRIASRLQNALSDGILMSWACKSPSGTFPKRSVTSLQRVRHGSESPCRSTCAESWSVSRFVPLCTPGSNRSGSGSARPAVGFRDGGFSHIETPTADERRGRCLGTGGRHHGHRARGQLGGAGAGGG